MMKNDETVSIIKHRKCRVKPYLTLIGGILVHLTLGSYFTFGNLETYIISYLRAMSGEPNVRNVDSMWITNIRTLPSIIAFVLGGICEKKFGYKAVVTVGCFVFSASVGLTYFTVKESLLLVTISYGLFNSMGSNFAYGIPIQASIKWFPNRPGLAIGMIMCGFGGGTLIFNQVITAYINPDNLSPDMEAPDGERYFTNKELLERVPYVFLIMGGMKLAMHVVGIPMISIPTEDEQSTKKEENKNPNSTNDLADSQRSLSEVTENGFVKNILEAHDKEEYVRALKKLSFIKMIKELLKTRNSLWLHLFGVLYKIYIIISILLFNFFRTTSFVIATNYRSQESLSIIKIIKDLLKTRNTYVIFVFVFMLFSGMQYPINLYKAYGQTFISDDTFLALIGSISAVSNCLFRPIWGVISDKYGFKVTSKLISALFVCILCSLTLTEKMGKGAYMVWICASYGAFCGVYPVAASEISRLFGASNIVIDLALLAIAISSATLFGGVTGIAVKDTLGWNGLFLLSGFLGAIGFLSTFFYKERTSGHTQNLTVNTV